MKPTVLVTRARPPERLDLSPLVPHRLAGQSAAGIEAIELQTTRHKICVGDAFHLRLGDVDRIRIEGDCDRLDRIGEQMTGGELVVEGDAGIGPEVVRVSASLIDRPDPFEDVPCRT